MGGCNGMSSLTKTAKGGVEMCNPVQMHISESVKLLFSHRIIGSSTCCWGSSSGKKYALKLVLVIS